jgi:glycogen debranching enzyme
VVLGERLPADIAAHLARAVEERLTPWGPATELPSSPLYESDGYWRGPVWAPSTYLVADGLRRAGHAALAERVGRAFLAACERSGFAENFDALTGEGLRDRAYTWTAAVYLLLASELNPTGDR